MDRIEALREAYVTDAIDIETFERIVALLVADVDVALPDAAEAIFRETGFRARQECVRFQPTAPYFVAALKDMYA